MIEHRVIHVHVDFASIHFINLIYSLPLESAKHSWTPLAIGTPTSSISNSSKFFYFLLKKTLKKNG